MSSKKGTLADLYQYLDALRGQANVMNFDDLSVNAWQMFERSLGYPPEGVLRWAIDRGVKLVRGVKHVTIEYVEVDPKEELRLAGYKAESEEQ